MEEQKILERMIDVYQESIPYSPQTEVTEKNPVADDRQLLSSAISEIDGNYFLYFNEIYTSSFIRQWLKKILKKLTWEILKRQVYFNSAIRELLYKLIQLDYENSVKHSEINIRLSQLEQTVQQLSHQRVSPLEQTVQQLSHQRVSPLEQTVQQLSHQRVSQLEQTVQQLSPQVNNFSGANQQIAALDEAIYGLDQKIQKISEELAAKDNLASKIVANEQSKVEKGLWFNEPIWVGYRDDGEAYWVATTERIVEKSFVMQCLARLYESTQIEILDVGAAESLLSYELASLNYSVTAIDIRPIALSHPNLKFVKSDICKPVLPPSSFDCAVALSTLEHIGLGWYGDEGGDNLDGEAVKQINLLLKPGGSFILTVPYGKKALTPVHRIYDQESLQRLVQDFNVAKVLYGVRLDDFTWTLTDNQVEASQKEHNPDNYLPGAVAMLVCHKNL
jgi:SAM-dependent methyltransferase